MSEFEIAHLNSILWGKKRDRCLCK